MASDPTTGPGQFTLEILSPSRNVPQPLLLENLPITTTVGQLKARIRDHVSTKPSDDAQRLIHRGRLLVRDMETMLELFGQDMLRSGDRQILHLVLRDLLEGQTPTPPLPFVQPSSRSQTPGSQQPHYQQNRNQSHIRVGFGAPPHHGIGFGFPHPALPDGPFGGAPTHPDSGFGFSHPTAPTGPSDGTARHSTAGSGFPHATAPNAPFNGAQSPPDWTPQQVMQNQVQIMTRLGLANHFQPPGLNSMGYHTAQNPGGLGSTTPGTAAPLSQPETNRTIVRESIGADGQRWRFTVNESIITSSQGSGRTASPLSPEGPIPTTSQPRPVPGAGSIGGFDLQNTLRAADAGSAARVLADAMRRNASSPSSSNLATPQGQQPIPPGVTTSIYPLPPGSSTLDPSRAAALTASSFLAGTQASRVSPATPEVYLLSSPSGPRAILLNGNLGTYYSPQLRSFPPTGLPLSSSIASENGLYSQPGVLPQIVRRTPLGGRHTPNLHLNNMNNMPPGPQPRQQRQHGVQAPGPMPPQLGHVMDNHQIQAIGFAQMWPHIWLMIRLAGFIWWFTTPTSSWLRWITVVSIAITMFMINLGVLHPLVDHVWVPLRRHIENLLPPAADAGARRRRPAADNARDDDANTANPVRPGYPNPANTAARLVQRRRQTNADWLLDQARRLERAGILFIASLAPGLAERHIAQAEAEALERQRQQEAEAAAAAAAAAAALATQAAAQSASEDADTNMVSREIHRSSSDGEPPVDEAGSFNGATS